MNKLNKIDNISKLKIRKQDVTQKPKQQQLPQKISSEKGKHVLLCQWPMSSSKLIQSCNYNAAHQHEALKGPSKNNSHLGNIIPFNKVS